VGAHEQKRCFGSSGGSFLGYQKIPRLVVNPPISAVLPAFIRKTGREFSAPWGSFESTILTGRTMTLKAAADVAEGSNCCTPSILHTTEALLTTTSLVDVQRWRPAPGASPAPMAASSMGMSFSNRVAPMSPFFISSSGCSGFNRLVSLIQM